MSSILDAPKPVINAAYVEGYVGGLTQTMSSPSSLKYEGGRLYDKDFESAQKMAEFENDYPELKKMDRNAKVAFLNKKILELRTDLEGKRSERFKLEERSEYLRRKKKIIDCITEWGRDLKIEKPDGPSFRALRKAVAEGDTICFSKDIYGDIPANDFEKEVFRLTEIVVIEHDWASAFKGANIDDSVIKLPYDVCAFEFKFSGRPVIALATQFGSEIAFTPAIYHEDAWFMTDFVSRLGEDDGDPEDEGILILMELMKAQIKAACIALDAQVATAEVVREPHVPSHGSNNYQPLKSYHVVKLANRGARALPMAESAETGRRIRLHFRRGHWRHFESHKTWVKWCLVGDPDLGFVDKHYKL
jgi:hypothetical protein